MGKITQNKRITDLKDQNGVSYKKHALGSRVNDETTGLAKLDTVALTEGGIATVPLDTEEIVKEVVGTLQ